MRNLKLKSLASALLVFLVAFALYSVLDAVTATNIFMGVGVVAAGGVVTQQQVTGGDTYDPTEQYLDMREVERKVMEYKPYQTPLLTILADQKGGSIESWEHKYYAVDARGMQTTISAATAIAGGSVTLTVADASIFTKFNTVYVPALSGETKVNAGYFVMGIVTGFPSSTQITVKLINPADALAGTDFVANPVLKIYRGGSAHNEKAASTTPWGILPETDYNYVQIFMEQVEQTEYQKLMKKEADWNFADLKRLAIEDFKIQRERSFLAGVRSVTNVSVDGQNLRYYTCGGFLQDTGIPVNATFDLSDFVATPSLIVPVLKSIFTGNNGSKERFLLGGADFIESLEKVGYSNVWRRPMETKEIFGLNFIKMVSHFGTLNVMYYEQLDLLGMQKTAMVIDKPNITISDLNGKGFNVRPIDYKSSGIAAVDAAVIEQASTMLIKNKKSHMIINAVA